MNSGDLQRLYRDFVDRYQRGENISEQEAAARYREVAPQLPPEAYEHSAQEAFARMSPHERAEFGRYLAARQGHDFIDLNQDGIDDRLQDPDYLAKTTSRVHKEEPGLLDQLVGSGGGGHHAGGGSTSGSIMGSPLAKGVLGGIAAYGISRLLGGHHSSGHHQSGGLFGGHRSHRRHGHGGFEADDLFEGGDDEGFFGDGGGFFGDDED